MKNKIPLTRFLPAVPLIFIAVVLIIILLSIPRRAGREESLSRLPETPAAASRTTTTPIPEEENGRFSAGWEDKEYLSVPEENAVSSSAFFPQNIRLIGVIIRENAVSRAIIENTDTGTQDFYSEGDSIEEARVGEIHSDKIILEAGGQYRTLRFLAGTEETSPSPAADGPRPDEISNKYISRWVKEKIRSAQAIKQEISTYINELKRSRPDIYGTDREEEIELSHTRQVGPDTWEVGEEDVITSTKNARRIASDAEITPYSPSDGSGKTGGFRVSKIRSGSVWETMGFNDGDVIVSVNNHQIKNLADMIIAARSAQTQRRASVTLLRDGRMVTQTYNIK